MSREQLTEQQSQQDTAGPEAAPQNTHGLPPALHAQVMRLGPGDAQALRDLLTLYPVFSSGILAVAAPHVGNAAVQRAIAMVQQNAQGQPTAGAGPASNQAFIKDTLADGDTRPAAEPAWVAGARTYNDAHADLVAEFNAATAHSCLDASGQLDPQAVARWQRQHGIAADGKVGPHTLAAARQASAKAGPAAAADQRIPV